MSKKKEEDTTRVPVICLKAAIVFPGQHFQVQLGRDFSRLAVEKALEGDRLVFVTCQKDPQIARPAEKDLSRIGTLSLVAPSARHLGRGSDSGVIQVSLTGQSRAEMLGMEEVDGYFSAEVKPLQDEIGDPKIEMALGRRIEKEFQEVAEQKQFLPPQEMLKTLSDGVSASILTDTIAAYFPMDLESRQDLLNTLSVNDRMMKILEQLELAKEMTKLDEAIEQNVENQMKENQREYYLRTKMSKIREELGEDDDSLKDTEIANYRKMLQENPYPEKVKKRMKEEVDRYEAQPENSAESAMTKAYLDTLFKVPWYQATSDREDMKEIQKILNEDHYGLTKVKERILEYIAVKKMTNSLRGPILCLVGPPGVGKTSLGRSIARSLDRRFVKISVGGVSDEAEIRGHRRTYIGAMPGKIISAMEEAGVVNPVFLIDEIDKMNGGGYHGDPRSAMLEVLDPEQNRYFADNYLMEPYDLSNVLFVLTANYMENIPEPLRDRLEIIEVSSYTEDEKYHIADGFLVPKQRKEAGLKPSQFRLKESEIRYLIRYYTHEAGVRELERKIGSLCRKTDVEILTNGKKSVTVTKARIRKWLGREIYEYGEKERKNQVGIATGLAYTEYGGDILPIEVTYYSGKGNIIMTGSLGDVMKESATVALGNVKSRAKEYGIDPSFFETHDIQIHVPEGAVPKDGPSAGVTLTTAIVSAVTGRPVSADLAMTGEVTLSGSVLPIGGLKEKSMAAVRSGIYRILIPKKNMRALEDLPETVRKEARFIPCETVDDVLKEALV